MPVLDLKDFSGGLNLRDSLEELGPNETPDALNMTLTTRGAVRVRGGCTQLVTTPAGTPVFLWYSHAVDKLFCQVGTTVYIRPSDLSGSWVSHITLADARPVAAADFVTGTQNRAYFVHPGTAGPWVTEGVTAVNLGQVTGTTLAVFKNRLWVADGLTTANPNQVTRLFFSNIGDGNNFNVPNQFVDVREKDTKPIIALSASSAGLLVFKRASAYRITDAATGAYVTIDWSNGCLGPQALVGSRGLVYTWGIDGIYAWDGIGRGVNVAGKLRPRFLDASAGSETAGNAITAARYQDRIVFAYGLAGAAANTRFLELLPATGPRSDDLPASAWIAEHQLAQSGEDEIASLANSGGDRLIGILADGDVMYSFFDGTVGQDDATAFTANYKTPPLGLGGLSRLQRARVYGKADATGTSTKELRTFKDWSASVADTFDITATIESSDQEEKADLRSLGHADAFQFEFRAHSGNGAAEFDRLLLDLTPLER